jgi:hypothetical protein
MDKKSGLLPYLQPFGRLGIVTIRRKFRGKWKQKGKKMMLIGFAAGHTGDTYKMFDPIAKTMRLSRDVKWLEWKNPDPYREMSIFNQQPDADSDPGIDDKESPPPPPPPGPNVIPDDGDADSEAGRIEERSGAGEEKENENENESTSQSASRNTETQAAVTAMV